MGFMINGNLLSGLNIVLPIGMFMSYPIWLYEVAQASGTPTAIEVQGWLIAVVASAMGLVKIAMWLRGSKDDKSTNESYRSMEQSFKSVIEKLVENDERLSINQQRLSDNQLKALENHAKLAEAITLLRVHLQSMENNIVAGQERRASIAVNEVKDILREMKNKNG